MTVGCIFISDVAQHNFGNDAVTRVFTLNVYDCCCDCSHPIILENYTANNLVSPNVIENFGSLGRKLQI